MSGMDEEEEEYNGPVTLVVNGAELTAHAHIAGNFDPLNGSYRWVGRLSPSTEVTEAFQAGSTSVTVRTPEGHEGAGKLGDANLWGGHPVSGSGPPPYPLPEVDPEL